MEIINLILGSYETNCYILYEPGQPQGIVIDPGFEPETIIGKLKAIGVKPQYILATHGHGDHIGAIPALKAAYPEAQVLVHAADAPMLEDSSRSFLKAMGSTQAPRADGHLEEGDEIVCGAIKLRVIHTPGHTAGGVSLLAEDSGCLFAGDTLFNGSVGRTDLPGGNFNQLELSIQGKLYQLPPEFTVYTGHGPATSIGKEKQSNPFVRANSSTRDDIHG